MDKRLLAILGIIAALFIGIAVFTSGGDNKTSTGSKNSNVQPTNHIEGEGAKGVTLIEYGDFQCSVCERYFPTVEQVAAKYKQDIYFQFRNLPLVSTHPNAFAAARAAESASLQNKFWEMYRKLYDSSNFSAWTNSSSPLSLFTKYAKDIGLNIEKFKSDYASSYVNDLINADLDAFKKTGQDQATPTFFLDGKYISNGDLSDPQTGQPSVDRFSKLIDAEIAQKARQ